MDKDELKPAVSQSPSIDYTKTPNKQTIDGKLTLTPIIYPSITNELRKSVTVTSQSVSPTSMVKHPIDYRSFIGLHVPPFPDKNQEKGSTLIDTVTNYGLHLVLSEDEVFMIWFTKSNRVLDILPLPHLGKMDIITTNYCSIDAQEDPEIFTLSTFDQEALRTRFFTNSKIRQAWRANRSSGEIKPISTKGIECSAEGGFDPNGITSQH